MRILFGDCREEMTALADNSVDAVVTDPPYDLTAGKKGGTGPATVNPNSPAGRSMIGTGNGGGFMGKDWDATGVAFDVKTWAECLRVLKPGGHLLAFGGTRTYHRMAVAIEDAGFEIRDSIHWIYGSGFPKSLDISKAIDKAAGAEREIVGSKLDLPGYRLNGHDGGEAFGHGLSSSTPQTRLASSQITAPATDDARTWAGWGTALKPAHEPIVMARKPLIGTVAANVLAHGTGGLNIGECRVEYEAGGSLASNPSLRTHINGGNGGNIIAHEPDRRVVIPNATGRWPANVIFDEAAGAELDAQTGIRPPGGNVKDAGPRNNDVYGVDERPRGDWTAYADAPSGASRFFYCSKAPTKERPVGPDGTKHPTVKPLALMRYLVRLVTPPGGTVLDLFAGSGATVEAAILEGFDVIGIEMDAEYLPLIAQRVRRCMDRKETG
jgi:DNA modification methylase